MHLGVEAVEACRTIEGQDGHALVDAILDVLVAHKRGLLHLKRKGGTAAATARTVFFDPGTAADALMVMF
ncbi:hypothetical protein GCM10011348_12740 [Marinobacterium nitratireducens]|uniref:Uncharacterized protein n=1 Tax=Marinobacterium nitratireducens TaxID=518897 RepID=A0A917Z9T9_9GAMM|nr:hypothetical protein GCM10011348_12740 [Marinobacterium nitratireducens]